VIYHTVHEDFSKLNPPRMDTPIMPDAQYIASYKKYVDKINVINAASSQGRPNFDADSAALDPYRNKALERQKELIGRDPRYHAAEKALAAKNNEIAGVSKKIAAEYDASPEGKELIEKEKQLGEKSGAARNDYHAYRREVLAEDKEYQAAIVEKDRLGKERGDLHGKVLEELRAKNPKLNGRKLDDQARAHPKMVAMEKICRDADRKQGSMEQSAWRKHKGEKGTALEQKEVRLRDEHHRVRQERSDALRAATAMKTRKLKMELMPLEKALDEAKNAALDVYAPESRWIASFEYKSFGKHYNFNYKRYFQAKTEEGGSGIPIHSNVERLQEIADLGNNPAVWRTEVDWDWRTPEEVSGAIDDLPLMQKWIERNRGPIQKSNPAGSDQ